MNEGEQPVAAPPRLKEHELKCWPEFFSAHVTGRKNFEIRSIVLDAHTKRDFQVGDLLVLREFVPSTICEGCTNSDGGPDSPNSKGSYTGRSLKRLILYVTDFQQKPDTVVMALAEWRESLAASELAVPCPERIHALSEHLVSLGGYTQASELEALGSELQRLREEREQLLGKVRRLESAGDGFVNASAFCDEQLVWYDASTRATIPRRRLVKARVVWPHKGDRRVLIHIDDKKWRGQRTAYVLPEKLMPRDEAARQ